MQRTPQRCPYCRQSLDISWDMWGQFYVCQGCGFAAEDDDDLKPRVLAGLSERPTFLDAAAQMRRASPPSIRP